MRRAVTWSGWVLAVQVGGRARAGGMMGGWP
jgi:hypothetical protein